LKTHFIEDGVHFTMLLLAEDQIIIAMSKEKL